MERLSFSENFISKFLPLPITATRLIPDPYPILQSPEIKVDDSILFLSLGVKKLTLILFSSSFS